MEKAKTTYLRDVAMNNIGAFLGPLLVHEATSYMGNDPTDIAVCFFKVRDSNGRVREYRLGVSAT